MKQDFTFLIIGMMFGAILGWFGTSCWYIFHPESNTIVTYETKVDTIPYYEPVARDSVVVRYERVMVPTIRKEEGEIGNNLNISQSASVPDTVEVTIPITQKAYADSAYTAWVSGYEARLDSIKVYSKTETIRIHEKPKRWHMGVTAGYGYTTCGFQPYIGVGITYSIFGF